MPGATVPTPSSLVMARSAEGETVVSSESVLLPGTGSGVLDVTEAVSVMMPSIVVVTTIVMVAVAPSASAPSGQVTTPAACEHEPWLGVADT